VASVPLSTLLEGHELRRFLAPFELESAGRFLIIDGYTRPALEEFSSGREVVFVVKLLDAHGERVYRLALELSTFRLSVLDLVKRTGSPVGPCILVGRQIDAEVGIWVLCGLEADGSTYDPLKDIPEYQPRPGAPVPRYH
jgi:hypothetical protein